MSSIEPSRTQPMHMFQSWDTNRLAYYEAQNMAHLSEMDNNIVKVKEKVRVLADGENPLYTLRINQWIPHPKGCSLGTKLEVFMPETRNVILTRPEYDPNLDLKVTYLVIGPEYMEIQIAQQEALESHGLTIYHPKDKPWEYKKKRSSSSYANTRLCRL